MNFVSNDISRGNRLHHVGGVLGVRHLDIYLGVRGHLPTTRPQRMGQGGLDIFFVFILPIIGALVYIGTRPKYMEDLDPDIAWAPAAGAIPARGDRLRPETAGAGHHHPGRIRRDQAQTSSQLKGELT